MSELAQVLRPLIPVDDPNALVDASTGDDAAVYLISEDRALVISVDFFSPVVDDGRDFGRIAATNALSDIYAMGAKPLLALNLLAFPRAELGTGVAEDIIAGGAAVAAEAGIPILGGHTIDDPEPKYGMVVVGEVHPDRMTTNRDARAGDVLVLTKPLGIGVITTAIKADACPPSVAEAAVANMATLNRAAAEVMAAHGIRAATDVTGYGLLGHLRSMARASGVSVRVVAADVPILSGARELAEGGRIPGGSRRNLADLRADVTFGEGVDDLTRVLLADAQTSGGILMAVPLEKLEAVLADLEGATPIAAVIGRFEAGAGGAILVE